MQLDILTPEKNLFSGEVEAIKLPGVEGEMGILNNHAALITALKKGTIEITVNGSKKSFETNGGVVEVLNNKVIILSE